MFVLAITLSVLAMALGPVPVGLDRQDGLVDRAAHVFTLAVAPAIVIAGVIPHLYAELGAVGPVLMALGYGAFWLSERHGERATHFATSIVMPALTVPNRGRC